jgi:hypothetical protein
VVSALHVRPVRSGTAAVVMSRRMPLHMTAARRATTEAAAVRRRQLQPALVAGVRAALGADAVGLMCSWRTVEPVSALPVASCQA